MLAEYRIHEIKHYYTSNLTYEMTCWSHTNQWFIMHYIVGLLNYPTALNLAMIKSKVWVSWCCLPNAQAY